MYFRTLILACTDAWHIYVRVFFWLMYIRRSNVPCLRDRGVTKDEKAVMSEVSYTSAVGSLKYSMICMRLDIAKAVGVISRYMSNPRRSTGEL